MFYKSNKNRFYIALTLLLSSYTIQISSMIEEPATYIRDENIVKTEKINKSDAFAWYDARYYTSGKHFFPVAISAFSLGGYLVKQHLAEKNKIPFIFKKQDMFRIVSTAGLAAAMFENREGEGKSTPFPHFKGYTVKQLFTALWLATSLWDLNHRVRINFQEAKNISGACSLFESLLSSLGTYGLLKNLAASINKDLSSLTGESLGSEDHQERLGILTKSVALEKNKANKNKLSVPNEKLNVRKNNLLKTDEKIQNALQNLKEFRTGLLEETSRAYVLGSRVALQPFSIATAVVSGLLFHYKFLRKSPRDAIIATLKLAGIITLATAQFRDMPMQQAVAIFVTGILLYDAFKAFLSNHENFEGSQLREFTLNDLFGKVAKIGMLQTVVKTLSSEIIDQILDQEPKKSKKAEKIRKKFVGSIELDEFVGSIELDEEEEITKEALKNIGLLIKKSKLTRVTSIS